MKLHSDSTYDVEAACPNCHLTTEVPVTLTTLLKRTPNKSQIMVTLTQEPVAHVCQQLRFADAERVDEPNPDMLALPYVDDATGEIVDGVIVEDGPR